MRRSDRESLLASDACEETHVLVRVLLDCLSGVHFPYITRLQSFIRGLPMGYVRCLICLLLALMTFPSTSCAVGVSPSERREILVAVREGRFPDAERKLNEYLKRFEQDPLQEDALLQALSVFEREDALLATQLDKWVGADGKSYNALLARATYYFAAGWRARGGKYINETSQSQIESLEQAHNRAAQDCERALKLREDLVPAYRILMSTSFASDVSP